jgi:hypothetical protein
MSLFNAHGCVYVSEVITAIFDRRAEAAPMAKPPGVRAPRGLGVWPTARPRREDAIG